MTAVWLRIAEVAAIAQVHEATVRRAIRAGLLRAVRVNAGRSLRTRQEWVDEWLSRFDAAA